MARKIDYLTIQGFKSIERLDNLKLNDINILIGANGAGKSNFVSYFSMLRELVEQRLQVWVAKQGGANYILTHGVKYTNSLSSRIIIGDHYYEFHLTPTDNEALIFLNEEYSNFSTQGIGYLESNLEQLDLFIEEQYHGLTRIKDFVKEINSLKIFHFHDTSNSAGMKLNQPLQQSSYLMPHAENLAPYLFDMQSYYPDTYQLIRRTIQLAIPFFDDFHLEPRLLANSDEQIRLYWKQKDSDYILSPTQFSDGSLRFICLVTALMQPNPPSTIIIDEPELGLHPYALTLLASLIKSASTKMQVIVSTQSVPLLNHFSLEDLIVVERENNASVFKRLNEEEFADWLEDYSVGELWEKNILGGRP